LSCANVIPPSGGPKDINPPIFIKSNPENKSVYFKSDLINLYFNENITIKNIQQIFSLPDPDLIKKINSKGTVIEVNLKKNLKPNTTYVIEFKGSIIDLNEGNKLESFKYVFSTGGQIDSSVVSGKVSELEHNEAVENSLIGLYNGNITENFDSIIKNQKPDFFTFSDKNGEYNYSNLKSGLYTTVCIKDENLNLKYEINELVSMPKIIELKDSIENNMKIFLDERFVAQTREIDTTQNVLLNKQDSVITNLPEYGLLNLLFYHKFYKNKNYIGQIVKEQKVLQTFHINDSIITIENLEKGTYQLKIIDDLNKNEQWDTGNIKTLKKPEEILFFKDSIQIRSNWELDLIIDI